MSRDPRKDRNRVEETGHAMLALVTDGFGARGGIAQYNRDFLTSAAEACGGGGIIVLPRNGQASRQGLPDGVTQLEAVSSRAGYAIAAARRALRRAPRVIFCGHLFHAPLAAALAAATGARLVVQLHGIEVWGAVSRRCRRALERADLILAVSRDTRARALSLLRLAPERIGVLNNTVRPEFVPGDRAAARRRFGLGEETVVLSVGRLDRREAYKGHDRVIGLLGGLRARGLTPTYLIAGEGNDRDRLEALAREAGLAEQVKFQGWVDEQDLPDLYRAADLFALPSRGEGFGIAFIEAMACGTPAIGLAEGGASDALGDGALGACVSVEAFPAALARLVEHCGRSGPDLSLEIRQRFGQEAFKAGVVRHLQELFYA